MATVGVIRELRIFVPARVMMFVINARHLTGVMDKLPVAPGRARGDLPTISP